MGLIRAVLSSGMNTIHDMWKDFIYCDALDNDTLIKKGHAKYSPGATVLADDNVITDGSKIVVNNGQVMLIVENGRIIDVTAEPGGYEYSSKIAPSVFEGSFGQGLKMSFKQMGERFQFGGVKGSDQRAYFINAKEILNNKFGFGNIPYRDSEFNLTISLQGYGTFSYRIADPLLFYSNLSGNVSEAFTKDLLEPQIKAELQDALLPALGDMAKSGLKYDELPGNAKTLTKILRERMQETWREKRGIEIVSLTLSNIRPDDLSVEKIRVLQESRAYSDNRAMLGARVGMAQANAMESAASNSAGAMTGFAGMNVAQNAGGVNVSDLLKDDAPKAAPSNGGATWICECGSVNTSKFCPSCGKPKPAIQFCPNCGFKLDGPAKFCPECGQKL